jgi:hypothetical protein
VKTTQNYAKGTQGHHACRLVELLEARGTSIPNTPMLSCPKIDSAQHSHKGNRPKARQIQPSSAHNGAPHLACFTHSIKMRAHGIIFAHQALCNPKISSLLKAVQRSFLNGCPNMSKKLILIYLNASPATTKGHMKRPRHGIQSTTPRGRIRHCCPCSWWCTTPTCQT